MKNKIIVVAAAIIKDHKLLVARRAHHHAHGGLWELPGGKVEVGEHDAAALKREILEELNLDIVVEDYVSQSTVELSERCIVMRVYCCRVADLTALVCHAHSEIYWAEADELPHLEWAPADIPILTDLADLLRR